MTEHFRTGEAHNPERTEVFNELRDRLEFLTNRSEILGIEVHAVVEQFGHRHQKHADIPVFGASLGKLPLAAMAIEHLEPGTPLNTEHIPGAPSETTPSQLIDMMLRKSDNVSFRVLAEFLGGPHAINEYYESKQWLQTRVITAPNGRALLAETTAIESLAQLKYILGTPNQNELSDVAREALSEQEVNRHGIRQIQLDDPRVHVFNKTGEYNGDPQDPLIYRHDVGSILGPNGHVSYAIMTTMPNEGTILSPLRKYLADSTVKHFGAELISFVGGDVGRRMGALALKSS